MTPYLRAPAPECLSQVKATTWPLPLACSQAVRSNLFLASGNRCAFCDGLMRLTSRATVEHFRPKSKFPELAAIWSNLFPCCDACQSAKGQKFDALLLKPDEADYHFLRFFVCNFLSGEINVAMDATATEQKRAIVTIEMYDLNSSARRNARLRERKNWRNDPLRKDDLESWQYRFFLE